MVWASLRQLRGLYCGVVNVIPPITRTTIAMYEHPDDEGEESDIVVCILRTPVTGVDVAATLVLVFNT